MPIEAIKPDERPIFDALLQAGVEPQGAYTAVQRVKELAAQNIVALFESRFDVLKGQFDSQNAQFTTQFDAIDAQLKARDALFAAQFDAIDARLKARDALFAAQFDAIDAQLKAQNAQFAAQFDAVNAQFDAQNARFDAIHRENAAMRRWIAFGISGLGIMIALLRLLG